MQDLLCNARDLLALLWMLRSANEREIRELRLDTSLKFRLDKLSADFETSLRDLLRSPILEDYRSGVRRVVDKVQGRKKFVTNRFSRYFVVKQVPKERKEKERNENSKTSPSGQCKSRAFDKPNKSVQMRELHDNRYSDNCGPDAIRDVPPGVGAKAKTQTTPIENNKDLRI
ncbi:unnamed protein product [Cyclocybe aegerita]|uniref:Uncharacterized protein n=1 Tax=Cyclocybe aegerita TaxID=1973307 RepID=A0A8S0WSA3_CYCAE|nr:unnamed protein product [Cyclocybe aegerita]